MPQQQAEQALIVALLATHQSDGFSIYQKGNGYKGIMSCRCGFDAILEDSEDRPKGLTQVSFEALAKIFAAHQAKILRQSVTITSK